MANYHAVYIDSPYSWTYNTDSYDSKLGFYSNAWLTNETEETSETPVISCSYFYELGKQDEVGFTPRRISMSESSGILTVEGKQENVSSLVSKSFRLNSPSPRFLNLRESMRKRRPARFIVNNIITDDDAELNNIKDYLGLNEEEAEAISRSEEFGADELPAHLAKWKMDYQFTARNGERFDIYNLGDECLRCGFYEYYYRNGVWYCADCRAKKSGQRNAEEFGAEAYEGFEQGNHHIQDKYFYELNERENEYWSGGQNQLNPIWGNESLINSLITENLNEEGYSPKFIIDYLLLNLKQKEKELNIIQRRYKDENIKTFLRRNPFTSRRVMNPDFDDNNDNMMGMTPSEGWGSAWINIAIKSLNQEIEDIYDRDMNMYGDMPDGAWDYVGELQEIRKQLRRDGRYLRVFGVPYNAESFGAEEGGFYQLEVKHNMEDGWEHYGDYDNEEDATSDYYDIYLKHPEVQLLEVDSEGDSDLIYRQRNLDFEADALDEETDEYTTELLQDMKAQRIMKLLRIVRRKATGSNARYAKTYAREAENAYYQYGMKGLNTQVAYVLSNLSGWRGEEAKSVKAELRKLIK